jgi:hypothetical protein
MIWIVLVVVVLLVLAGLFLFWRTRSRVTSEEARAVVRWSIGMTTGGIAGIVIGIMLVEFAGYSYPFPFVLWLVGMAAGQVGGILYNRYKKRESQI